MPKLMATKNTKSLAYQGEGQHSQYWSKIEGIIVNLGIFIKVSAMEPVWCLNGWMLGRQDDAYG